MFLGSYVKRELKGFVEGESKTLEHVNELYLLQPIIDRSRLAEKIKGWLRSVFRRGSKSKNQGEGALLRGWKGRQRETLIPD